MQSQPTAGEDRWPDSARDAVGVKNPPAAINKPFRRHIGGAGGRTPVPAGDQRRRLRIWRGSPIWGALVWVVAEICLQQFTGPWTAVAISSAIVIVLGGVARTIIGDTGTRVRTVGAMTIPGHTDAATIAARNKLAAMASRLYDADERVSAERMSPIEHEARGIR